MLPSQFTKRCLSRETRQSVYELDPNEQPPKKSFLPLSRTGGFSNADGFAVRDLFMEYFNSNAGTVLPGEMFILQELINNNILI